MASASRLSTVRTCRLPPRPMTLAAAHARHLSAFETLTEATPLGHQKRRPTVHVRVKPPRSDGHATSSGVETTTITGTVTGTGTGTGMGTFTSTSQGQTKSRSQHGHSNSLGSASQGHSDDSFMWTPGHGRSRSFGKSALRVVRTTANTAAALCGKNVNVGSPIEEGAGEKAGASSQLNEKAAAMEEALRQDGTKFIHLRDQVVREQGQGQRDAGIVVITPPPDSGTTQHSGHTMLLGLSYQGSFADPGYRANTNVPSRHRQNNQCTLETRTDCSTLYAYYGRPCTL